MDEDSSRGNGYLCDVCEKWEAAARITEQSDIRTVQLRTGVVLDKYGGALNKMLIPFKMGGGGILGDGKQYMSWIAMDDIIQSIRYIIKNNSITGPVNLVAPNPVTNYEFTKTLGKVLHRPTFLPLPDFAARLIFGEMADSLLLSSTRVNSKKLIEAGYKFKHEYLENALEDILK
ncbi:MAG: TIGR01777 family oxidoreductase [Pontiella sp.]